MGLDIYLRKCPNLAVASAAEGRAEAASEKIWAEYGKYESMSDSQKDEARKASDAVRVSFGCTGEFGRHHSIEELDAVSSKIDPDHMFKIGYFRSSYNEGGIERVLRNRGLPTLHDIFGADDESGDFIPDWDEARAVVEQSITGYEAHLASSIGPYDVSEVRPMWEFGVEDQQSALSMFAEQLAKKRAGDDSFGNNWSNRDGEFMLDGMKVCAIITRKFQRSKSGDRLGSILNQPSVFVVYEKPASDKPDWYLTALRIVRESIEYVLAQPDKQHYYLVWSG